jgi:hypothetical protein
MKKRKNERENEKKGHLITFFGIFDAQYHEWLLK